MNISGRLTADAQVSTTTQGKEVVNFSIAVNDGYRNKQGAWVKNTAYIDCAYWRSAKVAKWLQKGLIVELTGQISTRAWLDKQGNPKAGINFFIEMMKPQWGTANKNDATQEEDKTVQDSTAQKVDNTVTVEEDDSLPF